MQPKIRPVHDTTMQLSEIGRLRARVWRLEESINYLEFGDSDCWLDRWDADACHWVAELDGRIVASARLTVHASVEDVPYGRPFLQYGVGSESIASINRLVVDPSVRGLGLGRQLDQIRIEHAYQLGATVILALPVGESRRLALESLGYRTLNTGILPEDCDLEMENAKLSAMVLDVKQFIQNAKASKKNVNLPKRSG